MKGPSFKMMITLLGLPLFVALADWAWTQGPVYKYRTAGVSAYYQIQESFEESVGSLTTYGVREAYVNLSEGAEAMATGGISGPYFQLNFQVSISTSAGYGSAYGNGPISAKYVTFDSPAKQSLTLNVDSNLLDYPFYKNQSGTILVQFPSIALTWTRSENDWERWEGHRIQDMGNLVLHSQGTGVYYFTIPTGTITLPDIPAPVLWTYAYGYLGSQKALNWTVQRGPNP